MTEQAPATLPHPPTVELEIVSDVRLGDGGFLVLRRTELKARASAGPGTEEASPIFAYDVVDRRALDAAVMAAYHVTEGRVWVWLRSCLRPPLGLRHSGGNLPAVLWELPAGLVEPGESPRACAARELDEELGFRLEETAFETLGAATFPAPALIGEVHHFFRVRVDPASRTEPAGDGSPVEAGARIVAVPLDEALAACRRGELRDEKTELALRRLADVLA